MSSSRCWQLSVLFSIGPPFESMPAFLVYQLGVHRLPTTAAGIQQMVLSAAQLATALNETARAARIERLHHELQALVRDMEGNKELLESRLDKELKDIDDQRAKLDDREREAVAAMVRDDAEYQMSMSSPLDRTVAGLFDGFQDMPLAVSGPVSGETANPTSSEGAACDKGGLPDGFNRDDDEESSK